jgi:hypothetical protein
MVEKISANLGATLIWINPIWWLWVIGLTFTGLIMGLVSRYKIKYYTKKLKDIESKSKHQNV